jgi:molybdenum cofactor cytidylyltransferase
MQTLSFFRPRLIGLCDKQVIKVSQIKEPEAYPACAIILAAGQGSRLGGLPKCLMTIEGKSLLERQILALREASVERILVVTGYYHQAIEHVLACQRDQNNFPCVVRNSCPESGQASSVRIGIEALVRNLPESLNTSTCISMHKQPVLIMLCDQPLINAADIQTLIAEFHGRPFGQILMPIVNGQRGNPCVFSLLVLKEIVQSGRDEVCRSYMNKHPETVFSYESSNPHYILDVDDEKSISLMKDRFGLIIKLPEK